MRLFQTTISLCVTVEALARVLALAEGAEFRDCVRSRVVGGLAEGFGFIKGALSHALVRGTAAGEREWALRVDGLVQVIGMGVGGGSEAIDWEHFI